MRPQLPHLSKSGLFLADLQDQLMSGQLSKDQFDWAGCGWPLSLNVPRGKAGGMRWQLVVMVSSILMKEQGRVIEQWESTKNYSWSYCGVRKGSLPDNRPLGFPFDRNFLNLSTLIDKPNWALVDVNIRHLGSA